ncbi:MAG: ribonuclease P protein component [Bacteroidales bacterium]|nr:ribonuclease P protein component [Bacteroidales bacterium]
MVAETPKNTFRKEERLCGELRIDALFREGKTVMAYPLRGCWRCLPVTEGPPVKVLFSAPKKKLHRAFQRNRAKRLMRESYRLQKHGLINQICEMNCQLQLAVVWQQEGLADYATVYARMSRLLSKVQTDVAAETSIQA